MQKMTINNKENMSSDKNEAESTSHVHVHGPNCNHGHSHEALKPVVRSAPKIGRNDPCLCGSQKKYKKCCGQ